MKINYTQRVLYDVDKQLIVSFIKILLSLKLLHRNNECLGNIVNFYADAQSLIKRFSIRQ